MENIADRYMELIYLYQTKVERDLNLDDIQFIKSIVAKEQKQGCQETRGKLFTLFLTQLMQKA